MDVHVFRRLPWGLLAVHPPCSCGSGHTNKSMLHKICEKSQLHKHSGPYIPPGAKAAHSAVQVSLLFSNRCSCHFHTQRPRCLNSKCVCAHLCANRSINGAKRRCGRVHYWRIAILWHQGVFMLLTDKKPRLKSGAVLCLQGPSLGYMYTWRVHKAHALCLLHMWTQSKTLHNKLNSLSVY